MSRAFHVMAKPAGACCNLRCSYCFFLQKDALYPDGPSQMSDEVLEAYVRQTIEAHDVPEVTIAWQGGEPTLMGLDFFRRALEVERRYCSHGVRLQNTLQTNGVLLDEEWCSFLHEHRFLVGVSLDGPKELHDAYRRDRRGASVFDRVVQAVRLLQQHQVDFNVLCTVNAVNSTHPGTVYRFFRDILGAQYLQFIPVVEPVTPTAEGVGTERPVTDWSVDGTQYGRFLIEIFDEWVRHDVGTTFVQFFDGVLAAYVRGYSSLCVLRPTCGEGVALMPNGDVYSCDHYVDPGYLLGNILKIPLGRLVSSESQRAFGEAKRTTLPRACRECRWLFACNGECPKNRVLRGPEGEAGLNWLCSGLQAFFEHAERPMQLMAGLLKSGRPANGVKSLLAEAERDIRCRFVTTGRNEPCPCGSGKKFKKCHGLG